jgi:PTH1 family peptidyl-tRNA hydrolase
MRKLVVGLGNPGSKYEGTRHNIGFEAVDRLAAGGQGSRWVGKFDGLVAEAEIEFHRVLILKPGTFMNLSGRSVRQALQFYKLELADLLVVCDDLSLRSASSGSGRPGPTGVRKGSGTSAPSSAPTAMPASGSGSAIAVQLDAADYRPQPFPIRRTSLDRRCPDRRNPGHGRLDHPGAGRRHESIQRARRVAGPARSPRPEPTRSLEDFALGRQHLRGDVLLDSSKVAVSWDAAVQNVHDMLTKHNSEIVASRQWDERRLAYPVEGHKKGTYL